MTMMGLLIFIFGLFIGALIVFIAMRNFRSVHPLSGIAKLTEDQSNEKQKRKVKILELIREKGSVTNNDIEKVLGVSDASATNYLQEVEKEGKIEQIGEKGRFVSYRLKNSK
ncbi:DUF977 family protein [Candidatus Peregrinibacteria bacterium]|nr:DUF977 family protein [Candidatus Peregrinibacteria bacterium]